MNQRMGGDTSLNAPVRSQLEGEWQDWLADDQPTQEEALGDSQQLDQRRNYLTAALGMLNERERRIFEARRLAEDALKLEDLAQEFGVSPERICQIEVRAFEKIQEAVQKAAKSDDHGRLH
jgi:RNA polymerase sigma-32 factor